MYCMTVTYPIGDDTHFDYDYYQDKHMPMCAQLFAEHGYVGVVVRKNQGKGPGSGDLDYVSVDLLFESKDHLKAGLAAAGAEIQGDIPNYTSSRPRMSFAEASISLD